MSITIRDIAKFAGVSVGTASKVINNQGNVKEALRFRVTAVVDKFNYRPSSIARGMKINRTKTIGLIIPKISNTFYVKVIELIEKEVNSRNYTLVLGNSSEHIEREINCLKTFSNMRVDGLILASTGLNQAARIQKELGTFQSLGIPVLLISRMLPGIDADTVELENQKGAFQATRYLIEKGHKRIGMISSSSHTSAARQRIKGYMRALEKYKLPHESPLVHMGGLSSDSGYVIMNQLLSLPERPSAVFVGSNFQLLGTLRAIKTQGIRIPEDISLICFDDTEWSAFSAPPLTAIEANTQAFSKKAVDLIFERIDGTYAGKSRHLQISTQLVVRESVKKLED